MTLHPDLVSLLLVRQKEPCRHNITY